MSTEELLTRIRDLFGEEPAKIIDYLHAENRVLREMLGPGRLRFSPHQRSRLARAGYAIRDRLADFATVARPETILGWYRSLKRGKWDYSRRRNPGGRPRTAIDTVALVLRMADENSWGADRIVGELRKLGHFIDDNTVTRILRDHGYPTGPERRGMSWREFIAAHIDTIWATDMFTEEIVTRGGLVTVYVLFFIHLATRRVHIAGCTPHPDTEWMKLQARQFTWNVRSPVDQKSDTDRRPRCRFVIHDRDTSFLPLDGILQSEGIAPIRTPVRAPKANAFAERFVREARETLDNLIIVGERRMYRILKKIEHHHNEHRPHPFDRLRVSDRASTIKCRAATTIPRSPRCLRMCAVHPSSAACCATTTSTAKPRKSSLPTSARPSAATAGLCLQTLQIARQDPQPLFPDRI